MKRQFITSAISTRPKRKPPLDKQIKKRHTPKIVMRQQSSTPDYNNTKDSSYKIALIQPGSWGDNINSTLMFKPIKEKWPDSIIDVYTSTLYASAFHNNPMISNIIKYPSTCKEDSLHLVHIIPPELRHRGYNLILNPHPFINPDKWTATKSDMGTNIICAWIRALEDHDIQYTLPLTTILRLTNDEIQNANNWIRQVKNFNLRKNIMEVHGESGQTFWDHNWTIEITRKLCSRNEIVFISKREKTEEIKQLMQEFNGLVYFTGNLTIRENAELFNKCDRFFSVSSGLSNACNTNWCKDEIDWIEVINSQAVSSAPIRFDNKRFWYKNDIKQFIEEIF